MPPYHESSSSGASSASSSSNQSGNYIISKDDSALGYQNPKNAIHHRLSANMAASFSTPDLSIANNQFARPSPDRYRRNSRQMENTHLAESHDFQKPVRPVSAPIPAHSFSVPTQNAAATNAPSPLRRTPTEESVSSRYKRRSVASMPSAPPPKQRSASTPVGITGPSWSQVVAGKHSFQGALPPPVSHSRAQHGRSNSGEVRAPQGMRPASARHSTYGPSKSPNLRPTTAPSPLPRPRSSFGTPVNSAKVVIPQRPSTSGNPSRASQQGPLRIDELKSAPAPSPAVQNLQKLNKKSSDKGMKSRLRRAFSFSSSSELRKATAENNLAAERAKLRKERFEGDNTEQDAVVAAKQEASGLGNNIYSGQGQFAGSTDNISMASTASSASMMLRSIGRGMKKSSRNLRGLFRPKSMIGPSPSEVALDQPAAQVTLVTVEAEREQVNGNVDAHDVPAGGVSYPKLERNSVESIASGSRKSIVGGDRERAEVLAAVRKGILKRAGTSSTSSSPILMQGEIPVMYSSEQHSAPGSPSGPLAGEGPEGYFASHTNSASTRSLPTQNARNVSFGQRVQFFDVWSPTEYDRRGDVATCNRLTPMLAQQIKEELNSFKMVCKFSQSMKPLSVTNNHYRRWRFTKSQSRIHTSFKAPQTPNINDDTQCCIQRSEYPHFMSISKAFIPGVSHPRSAMASSMPYSKRTNLFISSVNLSFFSLG